MGYFPCSRCGECHSIKFEDGLVNCPECNANKPEQVTLRLNCECGSEVTGSNKHSSWCPKHEQ